MQFIDEINYFTPSNIAKLQFLKKLSLLHIEIDHMKNNKTRFFFTNHVNLLNGLTVSVAIVFIIHVQEKQ